MIDANVIRGQLSRLALTQVMAAKVLGVGARTMREYVAKGAPRMVFDALERYTLDRDALVARIKEIESSEKKEAKQ